MQQFDVCHNPNSETADYAPFLLVLQANLLEQVSTCVVAPLIHRNEFKPISKLHPVFKIKNTLLILATTELAGIPRLAIGKPIANLKDKRDEIITALDLIFTGI